MQTYKTKSGHVVTDKILDELGEACERGEYPGKPGEIVIAPVGRPKLSTNEELVTIAFKVPRSQRDLLDEKVQQEQGTRSEVMRKILDDALAS